MVSLKDETLTIASRDSLLALAQSIEAAHILQARGAKVRILTLKTSGDLKLDAPLYDVAAAAAPKEGRAFFTRELDDALLSGKAEIAVHSFKDLPSEEVAGVGEPIFFSQETGADILLLQTVNTPNGKDAKRIIGTSSLRRIHQLKHAMPDAETVMLRGNIVTRLRRLKARDAGMNAILIAGAGIQRLRRFASLHPDTYQTLLEESVLAKIARELEDFKLYLNEGVTIREMDELQFPTAPGQGVLALQMSTACEARLGETIRSVFTEHRAIAPRVTIERGLMAALGTGCHAPLGVSALERAGKLEVSVCYSRKTQMNPVAFSDSVFLRRQYSKSLQPFITESREGFQRIFWWGLSEPPAREQNAIISISALRQNLLNPHFSQDHHYAHIFVSSPAAIGWLKGSGLFSGKTLWAAGAETANDLARAFRDAEIKRAAEKGFAAAWAEIRRHDHKRILWLGSATGIERAKDASRGDAEIDFLPVYENVPANPAKLVELHPELRASEKPELGLHLLTSRASADAFTGFAQTFSARLWSISCFGASAAEQAQAEGFSVYHLSNAANFEDYLREIEGDVSLMRFANKENT